MKRYICAVIAAVALLIPGHPAHLEGQEASSDEAGKGGVPWQFFGMVGYQQVDLDDLNGRLTARQFPEFTEGFATVGGGANVTLGQFLIGAEGHALIQRKGVTTDLERTISGAFGFLELGYVLVSRDGFRLFPLFGIGGGLLTFETITSDVRTFDEILDDPGSNSLLESSQFLLQASLGADYCFCSDDAGRGLVLGLRAGYTFAPDNNKWQLNGRDIPGGADVGVEGFTARLSLGVTTGSR